jgi:hypothetical protein
MLNKKLSPTIFMLMILRYGHKNPLFSIYYTAYESAIYWLNKINWHVIKMVVKIIAGSKKDSTI